LNASNINYKMKQQILLYIRDKIGYNEYKNLYNSIGEVGAIEIFMKQMTSADSIQSSAKNNFSEIEKFSWLKNTIIYIFLFTIFVVGWCLFYGGGLVYFGKLYIKMLAGIF
jgi:hypothetical protein